MTNDVRIVERDTCKATGRWWTSWSVLLAVAVLAITSMACDDGESDRPGGSGGAVGTGGSGGSGGDGGTGGTGGTGGDGGTGGTGGQGDELLLEGRACTDFSGALDRVFVEGESLEPSRCIRMALIQVDSNPPQNLQLPDGWTAEPAQLHLDACDAAPVGVSGKPIGLAAMANEIAFESVDSAGFPTTFSADVTFVLPEGSGSVQRFRLLTGTRLVSNTCTPRPQGP